MVHRRRPQWLLPACLALGCALSGCDSRPAASLASPVAKHDCLKCHATDGSSLLAPGFPSISSRYSDDPDAAAALARSFRSGSHGKWSEYRGGTMPPQPQLSEAERKELIEWILKQPR